MPSPTKKTWRQDERRFKLHLKPLRNYKLSVVKIHDTQKLHIKIGREIGQLAANRALILIHAVFNKAGEWGFMKNPNPAKGIKRFSLKRHG